MRPIPTKIDIKVDKIYDKILGSSAFTTIYL